MILVTGAGRCGSSLMMQTLELLDVPLVAPVGNCNTLVWQSDSVEYQERWKEMNPKGIYEVPIDFLLEYIRNGWTPEEFHTGKAVKILSTLVSCIKPELIEKIIICSRKDRDRQAESMYDLAQLELEVSEITGLDNPYTLSYRGKSLADMKEGQDATLDVIYHVVGKNNIPTIEVHYEDMLEDPEKEIDCIACFLETNVDITNAVNNVNTRTN
jgi:hypothetical protein